MKKIEVDAFIILTDNESWAGRHPVLALKEYREKINPNARLVSIQMSATHPTTNDPNDRLSLDCVGFDVAVPEIVSSFIKGDF
jgi:60 kDa SS-A/Ro ribonucleoprotein